MAEQKRARENGKETQRNKTKMANKTNTAQHTKRNTTKNNKKKKKSQILRTEMYILLKFYQKRHIQMNKSVPLKLRVIDWFNKPPEIFIYRRA